MLSKPFRIEKLPGTKRTFYCDFVDQTNEPLSLVSGNVTVLDEDDVDVTNTMVVGPTVIVAEGTAIVTFQNGTSGKGYRVKLVVTLENGDIEEQCGLLFVKNYAYF